MLIFIVTSIAQDFLILSDKLDIRFEFIIVYKEISFWSA